MIHESIVDPNSVVATGFPANVMPSNFSEMLSPEELDDLVEFLVEETGGGAPTQGGKPGGSKPKGG
jgi:hypothetical protein